MNIDQDMAIMSPMLAVRRLMSALMEIFPIIVDPTPSAQTQWAPSVAPVCKVGCPALTGLTLCPQATLPGTPMEAVETSTSVVWAATRSAPTPAPEPPPPPASASTLQAPTPAAHAAPGVMSSPGQVSSTATAAGTGTPRNTPRLTASGPWWRQQGRECSSR